MLKALTVEASNADEAISKIVESASRAGRSIREMAENALVLDTSVRAIQKLQDVVSNLTAPFNSFETAMRKANTMAGKSGAEFEELSDKIVALSRNIPLAREELAGGLYETISNGVPEDNWLEFLEQTSKAAVGGIADLGQTVTVTSTLIKTYGLEWKKAGEIQDKIQMTAKNGKTSFSELGQALPRVSGSAAQLGVSMDELMAVFATTTGVTGNTAEVSTQLAAVLNSLIKPSSEASKAAAAMGISFDAASVKACGGFQNFLTELDSSIQAYAAESGQLSQTIYGQLFGSAEALRLLGSLTGEQKDKFSENIDAMSQSAGTISGAYNDMVSTGDSFSTMLKNQVQSCMDCVGAYASMAAPILDVAANAGILIISLNQLRNLLVGIAASEKVVAVATKVWSAAQAILNAIMEANPVGIVIMAIVGLYVAIRTAYNNCEGFRNICDKVWAVVKQVASAIWDYLVKAFETVSTAVQKAWGWIKKFLGISDSSSVEETTEALDGQAKATEEVAAANEQAAASGLKAKKAIDWQKMSYDQLANAIENQKTLVGQLAGTNAKNAQAEANKLKQMEERYKKLGTQYNLSSNNNHEFDGKTLIANAQSYKALGNNITFYQNKLDKTNPSEEAEIERLSRLIAQLTKSQEAIKRLQKSFSQPASLDTLTDIENALRYQQTLLENAPKEQMVSIQQEIDNLGKLKDAMEDAAHVEIGIDQIETYKQLNNELSYYEQRLDRATKDERAQIQSRINELKKLKQEWDDTMEALNMPEDITKLNTISKLTDAVSYYQKRMNNASSDEIAEIQSTITALEEKEDALKRIAEISKLSSETDRLQGLSGRKLKMELELVGVDGVKKQIKDLQAMLDDKKNPLGDTERTRVEGMIKAWKNYGTQLKRSQVKVQDVWGSIKGVGGSIENMTDALKGNTNAWKKITAVIDGMMSLYDNFSSIISVIGLFTKASKGHAAAKVVEAGAEETEAGTTAESAATTVIASATTSAALGEETAAWSALAAAKTFAAHAEIPFVGTGIATGMISAQQAIIAAAAIPKFAKGAVLYGPTLGIMGEYSNAANNPEVVAPLNKLKDLIQPTGGMGGTVEFRIRRRELVGVLKQDERIQMRTR